MSHVGIRIFSEDDELHALDGSFADSIGYQFDTGKIAAELIGPQLKLGEMPAGLIGPQFDMAKMATALISPYLDPLTGLIELEQLLS